ncbi:MGMT family protein [Methanocorpusculum sp. MG]|uniref:MGMT family protein n=1 Tax=Methanocorpusculum petauri TaxID=3002863 RepID=A0ABT4ID88_9EURY|nr:MGMT family protein [Methanocorpusculum petauri]MCZ0859704.1 MGMT family protein [Methanocorpusculum petauri]
MQTGSCKFGLWKVIVSWNGNIVHQVQFVKTAPEGAVPVQFTKFLAGRSDSFAPLISSAVSGETVYARIYRAVAEIPYGETRTYREIALAADTHPRVVGNAMAKNPTALLVPCHRVLAADGTLGGFTPDLQIKKDLLKMEAAKRHTIGKS